jgi:hypothetical protein
LVRTKAKAGLIAKPASLVAASLQKTAKGHTLLAGQRCLNALVLRKRRPALQELVGRAQPKAQQRGVND